MSEPGREWGSFTPARDMVARILAGGRAPPLEVSRFACTIIKPDHLGDLVLAAGAISQLATHFGAERCALVVSTHNANLAATLFPNVHRLVVPTFPTRLFAEFAPAVRRIRRQLPSVAADHVVVLRHQRSLFRDFLIRGVPARQRHWLDRAPYGDRAVLTLPPADGVYPSECSRRGSRELAAHRQLLEHVLSATVSEDAVLPRLVKVSNGVRTRFVPGASNFDYSTLERAHQDGAAGPVVIAPFAHNAVRDLPPKLVWSEAVVAAAAERTIVLCGAKSQEAALRSLASQAPAAIRARVRTMAGASISEWIGILADAALVVSGESATAHLATALDRPLVATIGGGHFGILAPWSRSARQQWVANHVACYHCDWLCHQPEAYCLTGITTDAWARAVNAALHAAVSR